MSGVFGVFGSQQVGHVEVFYQYSHAALWEGSAASWIDLHPAGAQYSAAKGVLAGRQVGSVTIGDVGHASMWTGSAESWVDLSLWVPGSWRSTYASAIWSDATNLYVFGLSLIHI